MDLELILEEIRANNELKIDNDRKLIKQCPKGHLYADVNKNKTYYRQVYTENGKRFRIGISSKPEIIIGLLKKRLISAELEALVSDNEIITEALNHIERFSMPEEALKLSKEFSDLPKSTIFNLLNSTSDPWEQEEYEQSTYKIEQKTQMTSFGLQVRSKSELLIAEKLREFKVPFRYEQVLHIGNTQVIPDFTIRRSDGKVFLWEH